jgi:hypothetical protein
MEGLLIRPGLTFGEGGPEAFTPRPGPVSGEVGIFFFAPAGGKIPCRGSTGMRTNK